MTRVIGVGIILVGLVFVILAASPLIATALALIEGKPIPSGGRGAGALLGGGISMIAYGWYCARGLTAK